VSGYRLCKSICLKFPPGGRWLRPVVCALCADRQSYLFVGTTGEEGRQAILRQSGQEITTAEGRQAARDVAIELLATLHGALHDLNRVKRIVRLLVLVNSAPGFTEPHEVANGASELFLGVFGERGAHARSAFGAAQIPFGSCVEIEIIVEVSDSDSECQV